MFRCCIGTEAPEIAHSILEHNWYMPNPISDVWALGLLMLTLMGAAGPPAHAELPGRKEYKEDLRDNKSPKESAAIKEYFEYLQQLLPSHGQTSFVQQVTAPGVICRHLCMLEVFIAMAYANSA